MDKVTLDAAAAARLSGAGGAVEVCDEAGRVIGVFAPEPARPSPTGWGAFSAEQVERMKQRVASGQSDPGMTLDEIEQRYGHLWRTL